jgi:hypothetical protein
MKYLLQIQDIKNNIWATLAEGDDKEALHIDYVHFESLGYFPRLVEYDRSKGIWNIIKQALSEEP